MMKKAMNECDAADSDAAVPFYLNKTVRIAMFAEGSEGVFPHGIIADDC
jgi:hypothetical protein